LERIRNEMRDQLVELKENNGKMVRAFEAEKRTFEGTFEKQTELLKTIKEGMNSSVQMIPSKHIIFLLNSFGILACFSCSSTFSIKSIFPVIFFLLAFNFQMPWYFFWSFFETNKNLRMFGNFFEAKFCFSSP